MLEKLLKKPFQNLGQNMQRGRGISFSEPEVEELPPRLSEAQLSFLRKNPGATMIDLGGSRKPSASKQAPVPTPSPTPAPTQESYRHPIYDQPITPQPGGVRLDELLSATAQASQNHGVPQDLLMDIPAIESSGGQFPYQLSGGPGRGPYQFEVDGQGRLAPDLQARVGNDFDVFSATDSADLAGQLIAEQQLSRWGKPGGTWGSLDALIRRPDERLTTYYDPKTELNPYLPEQFRF
jgi:hypothetical protein